MAKVSSALTTEIQLVQRDLQKGLESFVKDPQQLI